MSKTSEGFARAIDRTYDQAIDDAVKVVRERLEEVLSKQTPDADPLGFADSVNSNLRLVATGLSDALSRLEALKEAK
jgi:hypothetical protein